MRRACLEFPGAYEDFPFGPQPAVFKVRAASTGPGKVFALMWADGAGARVNLKCEPDLAQQLRLIHRQILPGYHMNKLHWNTVLVSPGGLPGEMIRDLIEDSYDLVVAAMPKRDRLLLDWGPTTSK